MFRHTEHESVGVILLEANYIGNARSVPQMVRGENDLLERVFGVNGMDRFRSTENG
jgi:hypothetical protein